MRTILIALIALTTTVAIADAKRANVRIHKPSQPIDASGNVPLAAIAPIAVAFDLARRSSCDVRVAVGTGKGDPGFDPAVSPAVGNWLVPAIYRRECGGVRPKWYGW